MRSRRRATGGVGRSHARVLLLVVLALGCEANGRQIGVRSEPVIYGADDREELYALPPSTRARIERSVVAIVAADHLVVPGGLTRAPTLGERQNFCSEEPFVEQPAPALCTGVLADWDLVLTASHCLRTLPLDQLRVVFGFYYRAPGELALSGTSSYELAEVVTERHDPPGASPRLDYAWIRLAQQVTPPLAPISIAPPAAREGDEIVVAGASFGLPLKVDRGAHVQRSGTPHADYFVADSDTSHGASGGPALDARGALLGVLARGADDAHPSSGGCLRSVQRLDTQSAEEEFTYAARAVEGLCAVDDLSSLCRRDCGEPCEALPPERPAASCAFGGAAPQHTGEAPLGLGLALGVAARRRLRRPRSS